MAPHTYSKKKTTATQATDLLRARKARKGSLITSPSRNHHDRFSTPTPTSGSDSASDSDTPSPPLAAKKKKATATPKKVTPRASKNKLSPADKQLSKENKKALKDAEREAKLRKPETLSVDE